MLRRNYVIGGIRVMQRIIQNSFLMKKYNSFFVRLHIRCQPQSIAFALCNLRSVANSSGAKTFHSACHVVCQNQVPVPGISGEGRMLQSLTIHF